MSKQYNPVLAELAAKTWEELASFEGEDADAQLIIERALLTAHSLRTERGEAGGEVVFGAEVLGRCMLSREECEAFKRDALQTIINDEHGNQIVAYRNRTGQVLVDEIRLARPTAQRDGKGGEQLAIIQETAARLKSWGESNLDENWAHGWDSVAKALREEAERLAAYRASPR